MPFGSLSSRWTRASCSLVRLCLKDTPYQQIINHKHKIERGLLNYLSLCVSIHCESTDTGQRVSDYRRTPFISRWGSHPHWSPGNMHELHQVVALLLPELGVWARTETNLHIGGCGCCSLWANGSFFTVKMVPLLGDFCFELCLADKL